MLLLSQIRQILKVHQGMKMEERKIMLCFFCDSLYFGGRYYIIDIIFLYVCKNCYLDNIIEIFFDVLIFFGVYKKDCQDLIIKKI